MEDGCVGVLEDERARKQESRKWESDHFPALLLFRCFAFPNSGTPIGLLADEYCVQ